MYIYVFNRHSSVFVLVQRKLKQKINTISTFANNIFISGKVHQLLH